MNFLSGAFVAKMRFFSKIILKIRWAANSYADVGSLIRQMHALRLVRKLAIDTGAKHIMDAGCGSGTYAFSLARQLPQTDITALDIDQDYHQQCLLRKEYSHRSNIRFVLGSLLQPIGEEAYDLVYSIDVLEHIENDSRVLENIYTGLKPGGYFVLHVPRAKPEYVFRVTGRLAEEVGRRAHHVRDGYESPALCRKVAEAGFEVTNMSDTLAKWKGGLAWEIYTILLNRLVLLPLAWLYKLADKLRFSKKPPSATPRWGVFVERLLRVTFGNLYIPVGLLFGFLEIDDRASNRGGQGILLTARKKS